MALMSLLVIQPTVTFLGVNFPQGVTSSSCSIKRLTRAGVSEASGRYVTCAAPSRRICVSAMEEQMLVWKTKVRVGWKKVVGPRR